MLYAFFMRACQQQAGGGCQDRIGFFFIPAGEHELQRFQRAAANLEGALKRYCTPVVFFAGKRQGVLLGQAAGDRL